MLTALAKLYRNCMNTVLAILKWPTALLSLLAIPGIASALFTEGQAMFTNYRQMLPFFAGLLAYTLVRLVRGPKSSLIATLDHEFTHSFFAVLTGHRVQAINTTSDAGGYIKVQGSNGNWLIYIAPYFIRVCTMAIILFAILIGHYSLPWVQPILGIVIAYSLFAILHEAHAKQIDLQTTGFLFAVLFLPGANLAVCGLMLALARAGPDAALNFCLHAWNQSQHLYRQALDSLLLLP